MKEFYKLIVVYLPIKAIAVNLEVILEWRKYTTKSFAALITQVAGTNQNMSKDCPFLRLWFGIFRFTIRKLIVTFAKQIL